MTTDTKFTELTVVLNGSSGIEIRAPLSKKYDCVEFSLSNNPQPVFISPWIQFEPTEMNEERARIAHDIVHRVINYPVILKRVSDLEKRNEDSLNREQLFRDQISKIFDMWRTERVKNNLPDDFSDITTWPPELLAI